MRQLLGASLQLEHVDHLVPMIYGLVPSCGRVAVEVGAGEVDELLGRRLGDGGERVESRRPRADPTREFEAPSGRRYSLPAAWSLVWVPTWCQRSRLETSSYGSRVPSLANPRLTM